MIVRSLEDTLNSDRVVKSKNWVSRRLILEQEGMGFSMHDTLIMAGTETKIWYKNHLEAVYCIEGKGTVTDLEKDSTHTIEAGVLYALDQNDQHILRAHSDMRLISIFNPPLIGREMHDQDGSYPLMSKN